MSNRRGRRPRQNARSVQGAPQKAGGALKTMTPRQAAEAIETGKTPRANWGANEMPRACPRCHGVNTTVKNVWTVEGSCRRTLRNRTCECGQVFRTTEKKG